MTPLSLRCRTTKMPNEGTKLSALDTITKLLVRAICAENDNTKRTAFDRLQAKIASERIDPHSLRIVDERASLLSRPEPPAVMSFNGARAKITELELDLKKANDRIATLEDRIRFLDQRCDELLEDEYRQSVEIARLKEVRRFKPRNVTEYVRQTSYTVAEAQAEKARIEQAFRDGLIEDEPRRKFKRAVTIRTVGHVPRR